MAGSPRAVLLLTLVVALGGGAGCSRGFSLPDGTRQLGQTCTGTAACVSGVCTDGVCCQSVCAPTQICNAPDSLGTCSDRPLGTACIDDATCPTGFCRDGVCCDTSCTDNCTYCAVDGGAGTCQDAPDNTDPRVDCGTCSSCFAGDCGPAFAATDPHGDCAAGTTCNGNYTYGAANLCGISDGYPCSGDACGGYGSFCVSWTCLGESFYHVDGYPFLVADQHRTPLGVAVGPGGAAAVLVNTDDGVDSYGNYLGGVVAVVAPTENGPWTTAAIEYNGPVRRVGAVAFTGDIAYFAVYSGIDPSTDTAGEGGYSGIYTQAVTTSGEFQGYDIPDNQAASPLQIALGSDARGQLTLASVVDGGGLRVNVRGVNGNWGNPTVVDPNADGVGLARLAGATVLFFTTGGELFAMPSGGAPELATGAPGPCVGPLNASSAPDDGGDQAGLTLTCNDVVYLAAYAPTRTDVDRWRFVAAPASSPFYGLEDDGVTDYPLSEFLPSGGMAGNVAYTGFLPGTAPGGPPGGYVQVLWMELDGGLAFAYSDSADSDYSYISMAAGGSPVGAPISAFDSVLDIDGGSPTNAATLLIDVHTP